MEPGRSRRGRQRFGRLPGRSSVEQRRSMLPPRPTILVVEDEASIAETLLYALQTEGYTPLWKSTGNEAIRATEQQAIALVVLDIGLPDMSGFDVYRAIQRRQSTPVIFLTARSGEVDKVAGLELGADDYVAKPFSPRELTARVRAVLRRTEGMRALVATSTSSGWQHDAVRCRISYEGKALELTRNEYRLLSVLLAAPGRVFSRDQLMQAAWDDPGAAFDRTVDAHIKTLRAKLRAIAPGSDPVVTHRGLGYSFRESA